jgi:hypothetical protein
MRGETPIRAAVATRLVHPLRHPESVRVVDGDRLLRLGVSGGQPDAPPPDPGRGTYLRWLTARLRSQPAATNPATSHGNLVADPFASRTMIQLAAAIEPGEWQRGYPDRALARRLSQGRVPDPIRLRRTRGGQGRDTLHVIRRHPDRLLDSLATTSADVWHDLGVDPVILRRTATSILDSDALPPHSWVADLLRVAGLAEFVMAVRQQGTRVAGAPGRAAP